MITNTHKYLLDKCERICWKRNCIQIFPTAYSMLENAFSGYQLKSIIKHYEKLINSDKYQEEGKDIPDLLMANQWSIQGISKVRLYGLATKPKVSITVEGQSYKSFTFTIFHELGHMFFGDSELKANEFAIKNNKRIWK